MSDHAVKVEPDHTTASSGNKDNVVVTEELVLDTSPAASLSPPVPSCVPSAAGVQGSATPLASKDKARSRSKMGRDDRSTEGKVNTDIGYAISTHVGKHLNRLRGEKVLQIKCAGRVMQGKQETNGNSTHHRPRDRHEPGNKHQRKKKPVTVDTSKAKTSLEALKMSIKQLKWKEFPLGRRAACDIYWHGTSFHDNDHIVSGQVNKFPGMIEMLKKINLSRALRTMHELFPEEYNFYPRSWILPDEYQQFSAQIRGLKDSDAAAHRTFIVKPDSGSQGEGIYLIREASEVRLAAGSQARQAVVQEYVQRPLLIDKLKFDIRLYVLVKALEPLQIYIAKEGLTRFCTEPYQEPNQKNLSHVFMHLTNYSLNVQSDNFVHSDSQSTGSKRTFSSVLYRLASKGVDIKKVWSDVISLVIKTVIALVPELKVHYQADIPPGKPGPTCFQILGFDILLTKNLKPVLLEVNSNPSMRIEHEQEVAPGVFQYVSSPVDEDVKVCVIRDTLRLMDPGINKHGHPPPAGGGGAAQQGTVITSWPPRAGPPDKAPEEEPGDGLPTLCLKQVYPKYTKQFQYLCLVDRIATLFLRFLGIKGNMRLGPTAFRTFIRCCKLSNSNLPMASVDILYIDITRRWAASTQDSREAGMGLQAFVEAFFQLAGRRSKAALLRDQVASLLEVCEAHLDGPLSALPVAAAAAVSLEDRRSLSRGRAMAREASKLSPSSSSSSSSTTHPPPLCSPAAPRRAVSHDQRLQRSRHGPLRTNLEN
ncbi:tubulin polyglutamylase TTLL11 isoform X2 [Gadus macrocephalus]|uniref:tubulin polyglutamylase TTLL11 isoform X2 n=1 Tax=Gadus macrocephalus TaxID=80720 RepID=UPI0028CB78FC|nr:tubulin polyglutamylase TTLL11 isoform X2 [Gadus macrocephalus]